MCTHTTTRAPAACATPDPTRRPTGHGQVPATAAAAGVSRCCQAASGRKCWGRGWCSGWGPRDSNPRLQSQTHHIQPKSNPSATPHSEGMHACRCCPTRLPACCIGPTHLPAAAARQVCLFPWPTLLLPNLIAHPLMAPCCVSPGCAYMRRPTLGVAWLCVHASTNAGCCLAVRTCVDQVLAACTSPPTQEPGPLSLFLPICLPRHAHRRRRPGLAAHKRPMTRAQVLPALKLQHPCTRCARPPPPQSESHERTCTIAPT